MHPHGAVAGGRQGRKELQSSGSGAQGLQGQSWRPLGPGLRESSKPRGQPLCCPRPPPTVTLRWATNEQAQSRGNMDIRLGGEFARN